MLIWVNSVTEKTGNGQLQWSTNNIHKAKRRIKTRKPEQESKTRITMCQYRKAWESVYFIMNESLYTVSVAVIALESRYVM